MAKTPQLVLTPTLLDLVMYAGDGVNLKITVNDAAGLAVAVTGSIDAQVKTLRTDTSALASFTPEMTQAGEGIVFISLTGGQTAALLSGEGDKFTGVWDVQWTADGDEPVTLVQGKATCDRDVTRIG